MRTTHCRKRRAKSAPLLEPLEGRCLLSAAMAWSSYAGGSGWDGAYAVAVDAAGNSWIAGYTESSDWVGGGGDISFGGVSDAFVLKVDATGQLLWSTYLGGAGEDYASAIAIDSLGQAWVTGYTESAQWVSGGPDAGYGGAGDAFVAKLDQEGNILWSTYIGGNDLDESSAIAIDSADHAWIAGRTRTLALGINGFDNTFNGGVSDAFVARIDGPAVPIAISYLGGTGSDGAAGIAIDSQDRVIVVGYTDPTGWAVGGFDVATGVSGQGFIASISNNALAWSSYLGGAGQEFAYGVAVDGDGNAYITGYTDSPDWISGSLDTVLDGDYDAFLLKVSPAGQLRAATYLGGDNGDIGYAVAADNQGNVWVAGETRSALWASDGFDTELGGSLDGFLIHLDSQGHVLGSSYLGGDMDEYANAMALNPMGQPIVVGEITTPGWASGGFDLTLGDGLDAMIAQVMDSDVSGYSARVGQDGDKVVVFTEDDASVVRVTLSHGWAELFFGGNITGQSRHKGVLTLQGSGITLQDVLVRDSNTRSELKISVTAPQGNRDPQAGIAQVQRIISAGALGKISAPAVDLAGQGLVLENNATLGWLALHDLSNGADLVLASPAGGVSIRAGHLSEGSDITLGSESGVRLLSVAAWDQGILQADWLGKMVVRGDASQGLAGDLGADLSLANATRKVQSIQVSGTITGGLWTLAGPLGELRAGASQSDWQLQSPARVANVRISGNMEGELELAGLGALRVGDRLTADITATATSGNAAAIGLLRAGSVLDSHIRLVDADNDGRRDGGIKTIQSGSWGQSVIEAGWIGQWICAGDLQAMVHLEGAYKNFSLGALKVKGILDSAQIHAAHDVGAVSVGGAMQSELMVGVAQGVEGLPGHANDFDDLAAARLRSFSVTGIPGYAGPTFMDTRLAAWSIGSITLREVEVNGLGDFGVAADRIDHYRRRDGLTWIIRARLNDPAQWTLTAPGEFDRADNFVAKVI